MIKVRTLTALTFAGLCWAASVPARAQVPMAPIVVRQPTKPKQVWVKGVVVHADSQELVLSDPANPRRIQTYTLSPRVHMKMEQIISRGGYQSGDRVKIRCAKGNTVVLALKGRPSKPV